MSEVCHSRQRAGLGKASVAAAAWVFTREDGSPLSPQFLTGAFIALAGKTGLPPVRLHDLRHGAATQFAGGNGAEGLRSPS